MGQLNNTVLGGANGAISTSKDLTDAQKAALSAVIGDILANSMDDNGNLKLYAMVGQYMQDGLLYYYQNSAAIIAEIEQLSGYLGRMLDNRDALEILLTALNYGAYVDKIDTLDAKVTEVKSNLTAPNGAIDTTSADLITLVNALNMTGSTQAHTGTLTLDSQPFVVAAPTKSVVKVTVAVGSKSETVSVTFDKTHTITTDEIDGFKAQVAAAIAQLGIETKYYTNTYNNGADLDALIGTALAENVTRSYTWTAKNYTVKIDDEADQTITVENLKISLPKADDGYRYEYEIDGVAKITSSTYFFTPDQIDRLFVEGVCTITRTVIDVAQEKLDNAISGMSPTGGAVVVTPVTENGVVTGITVTIDASHSNLTSDLMAFVMGLVNCGYDWVGLNEEALVNAQGGTLEVTLQTLVNALNITSADIIRIIDANGNVVNGGELLSTTLQLGRTENTRARASYNYTEELALVIKLDGTVPAAVTQLRNALSSAGSYVGFELAGGQLDFHFNLPEKIYEVYLAALLMTGNVDLDNINSLDQQVAYEFLLDVAKVALGKDVTATTYVNTAAKLGKTIDLSSYEEYISKAVKYLNPDSGFLATADDSGFALLLSAEAKTLRTALSKFINDSLLGMIVECQTGGHLDLTVTADIANFTGSTFEALVLDKNALNASGISGKANVVDLTTDLVARLGSVSGLCGIVLLDDITADLSITSDTYLDLNGHTITGNITVADGVKLTIIDSTISTTDCGAVTGTVTGGSIIIVGGKYTADVSGYLKAGYKQLSTGIVCNELYTVAEDANGNITIELNADILTTTSKFTATTAKALALDICGDILINYYPTAALSLGTDMGIFSIPATGVLDVYGATSSVDALIEKLIAAIDEDGISKFLNSLIADLTDFSSISAAIASGSAFATYDLTTSPWKLALVQRADNSFDVELGANTAKKSGVKLSLTIVGSEANKTELKDLTNGLGDVIDSKIEIDIADITKIGSNIKTAVTGTADVTVDLSKDSNYAIALGIILAHADVQRDLFVAAIKSNNLYTLKYFWDQVTVNQLITAVKKINRTPELDGMIADLGLNGYADAVELEKTYHRLLDVMGWVLDTLNISGGSQTMGSLERGVEGTYVADKDDLKRSLSTAVGGYTLACDLTVDSVSVTLKLFDENSLVPPVATYTVSFDANGGSGTMAPVTGVSGQYTLPANGFTAPSGQQFKGWAYSANGTVITDATIVVTENVTLYAIWENTSTVPVTPDTCPSKKFSDLNTNAWYHEYVDYVLNNGLMKGCSATEFAPHYVTTRGMVIETIYRMEGSPAVTGENPFTDVKEGAWYTDAIIWGAANGIINGCGDGTYRPEEPMTREQIVAVFARYAAFKGMTITKGDGLVGWTDSDKVSGWAFESMDWAVSVGLIKGVGNMTLAPQGETERVQLAAMLTRLMRDLLK